VGCGFNLPPLVIDARNNLARQAGNGALRLDFGTSQMANAVAGPLGTTIPDVKCGDTDLSSAYALADTGGRLRECLFGAQKQTLDHSPIWRAQGHELS
jgi:hypothetical protein